MPVFGRLARHGRMLLALVGGMVIALGSVMAPVGSQAEVLLRLEPEKVIGPDGCGECHAESIKSWKATHHAKTFRELPRRKSASAIAKKLGLRRIKSESTCLTCHFTSAVQRGKVRPIAGISCESCHGAGKGYVDVHSDYGGKDVKRDNEDPAHRKSRYEKSESAGMIRPTHLYDVAANCYSCHTVPNESLVNKGGHPAGSKFELVAWTQGEVRHNVWYSKENQEASAERRRMMFIVGKMLDLEFALRGVAKATQKKSYAVSMAKRAAGSIKQLKAIAQLLPSAAAVKQVADIGDGAALKLNNEGPLNGAADKIAAIARKFAETNDGSKFAALDKNLPGPDKYMGKP